MRDRDNCVRRVQVVCLLCAILLSACTRDPQVRKQKYYTSAIELLKKGKPANAALELRNALQIDPNFVEAANVLAELQARQGNYREAFTLLQQAEKTQPDYLPVRKGLAQLYRLGGKLAEAQTELEYILERTPDDTDALFNLGTVYATQKEYTQAEGSFNRILELQPSHVSALLALASGKEKQQDSQGDERYLKLALERNPRSVSVYLALTKFYIVHGRPAEAEPLFSQALRVSNNSVQILEAQEGYYEGAGKLALAEEAARKIRSSHPADPRYWSALADFYVRTGNWAKAKTELEAVLQRHKEDPSSLHKLIEVHLNLNDRKGAEALNEALLKKNPKDAYAHLLKGRFYLADGDIDKALLQFNETQRYEPDFAALYYWYAQAYLKRRDFGQARQALDTALKYDPDYQTARLELAEIQNRMGAADAAMSNAKRALQTNPADVRAMLSYSQSLISKQRYAEAEKIVKIVVERTPNSAEAHRQFGVLHLIDKNLPAAQTEFKEAWRLQPESKPVLEGLLMGYVAEKQTGVASDFLQREIQTRSNDPLLYHEMAQVYLLLGNHSEAVAALKKALSLDPDDADSALLLAEVEVAANQPEPAIQLAAEVMRKHAQDPDVALRAGMIFERAQRWDEAQRAYERVLQLDTGNAIAKNNLAWLLVSHGGNIDVALGLAQQAKEKLEDNLQVTDTIGWIYYKKKVYKMALDYLKQCVQKDGKNATFQYQLGLTYWQLGDTSEARRALLTALTLDSRLPEAATARQVLASSAGTALAVLPAQ